MPALASMKSVLLAGGIMALAMADAAGAVSLFAARNDGPGGNRADFINDARFENWDVDGNAANGQQAGWLARTQNATPINPPGGASNSVLPQFERAAVNFSAGSATAGVGTSYSVHLPSAISGLPTSAGGSGIHTGLVTTPGLAASQSTQSTSGSINVPWANGLSAGGAPPVLFEISRTGRMLTVRIGDASGPGQWDHVWTASADYLADVNAIQLRLAAGGSSSWQVNNLAYNGQLMPASQNSGLANGSFLADNNGHTSPTNREIFLWEGAQGDFTLSGAINLGWSLNRPTDSKANMQVRLLALDEFSTPAPEPASWLMLITGFGAVGAALRRRRAGALPA